MGVTSNLGHLVRGYQSVTWITDEDDIAANDDRLTDVLEIAASVSSFLIDKPMVTLAVNTTAIDDDRRGFEDLVAIPDLAAGALAEAASRWPEEDNRVNGVYEIRDLSAKSAYVHEWLASQDGALRKVNMMMRSIGDGQMLTNRVR